jgi:hypothetical protein
MYRVGRVLLLHRACSSRFHALQLDVPGASVIFPTWSSLQTSKFTTALWQRIRRKGCGGLSCRIKGRNRHRPNRRWSTEGLCCTQIVCRTAAAKLCCIVSMIVVLATFGEKASFRRGHGCTWRLVASALWWGHDIAFVDFCGGCWKRGKSILEGCA